MKEFIDLVFFVIFTFLFIYLFICFCKLAKAYYLGKHSIDDNKFNGFIIINNEIIAIKPNSFEYELGMGERGPIVLVKFVVLVEDFTISKLREWLKNLNNNVIQVPNGDIDLVFSNALLINKPIELCVDGEIQLEFHATPCQ